MFGYDQQMQLAAAWTKAFTDATTTAMQASTAMWGLPKPADPARSWYRAPAAPNPFDWTSWLTPPAAAQTPWASLSSTFAPQFGFRPIPGAADPWAALASFATTMSATQPLRDFWTAFLPVQANATPAMFPWQAMMWPMTQFGAFTAATADNQTPFAAYRSSGGHAAAQISFSDQTPSDRRISKLH